MESFYWRNFPSNLILQESEIHLWRVNLNLSDRHIQELEITLSEDEKLRANRFCFPQHRHRFIVARGVLRQLLKMYLHTSNPIIFNYSDRGKPAIDSSFKDTNLQFNLSHSQDLALYSFTYKNKIGIDLEYLRDDVDYCQISQRFFCPQEANAIANSPSLEAKKTKFYQLWTAKEAYLKAIGKGLAGGLDRLELNFDLKNQLNLYRINNLGDSEQQIALYNFIPAENFVASVILLGHKKRLRAMKYCFQTASK